MAAILPVLSPAHAIYLHEFTCCVTSGTTFTYPTAPLLTNSYLNEFTCCDTDGTNGAVLKPWLLATMLDWHARFPVSAIEVARNNVAYSLQVLVYVLCIYF